MPRIPDYELVRIVGRGSYGDVWLARSLTGAWRAIKVVWRERFTNAEPFEREFRGLKEFADISLRESSQMTLLHVGRNDAAGFFYYVMELADDAERGPLIEPANYVPLTLAEMRTRHGRIAADKCARFGVELARVLASLHRRGLVHRDVKPSNVIFVAGLPKLADVGLVAPTGNARTFVGTEGYVPPEGPGAPSADVFALGKMLYELSTGHDRQEFPKLPADLASLPDRAALLELNEIILRACGPSSADRYRDGAAILADLTAMNAGVSLRTRRLTAFLTRAAAAVAIVGALGWGVWSWQMRRSPPPLVVAAGISPYSVAVLPFTNATDNPALAYFCDGLSYEILHALERERDLGVKGSRSSFWCKNQNLSKKELATTLRVAQLVEGSVQRVGTRYRLAVRLTRADGMSEPVGTFEREASDVFALENDVARAVAIKILHRVTMPPLAPPTKILGAYGEFLRGRALQVGPVSNAPEAAKHFQHATELDPDFAVAWARLADAIRMDGLNNRGTKVDASARRAVDRALKLQPDLALAWCVSGFIRGVAEGDGAGGQRDLDRAEELAGPNAETRMARLLVGFKTGETRGLLPLAREAVANDPENIERIGVVMPALNFLGVVVEADRLYRRLIANLGPDKSAATFVSRVYLRRKWRGAEAALQLAKQAPQHQAGALESQVHMLIALGRIADARELLEGVELTRATWRVFADAGLTDRVREIADQVRADANRQLEDPRVLARPPNVRDGLRTNLIGAEIALGRNESALAHLEMWRKEVLERPEGSYRSAGAVTNIAPFYARLGRPDRAIEMLRQGRADGLALGYDLRDSISYESMRGDLRFLDLRREAEAWAATLPEPSDEPAGWAR
jgi:serine/threonine protein kinase/tetratricopeptide (TPR) repeat protein